MPLSESMLFEWLIENVYAEKDELDKETKLYSSGLIDSFSLMDLVVFIEKQSKIKIGASELTLENFDTVERILNFVEKKTR